LYRKIYNICDISDRLIYIIIYYMIIECV